MVIPPMSPSAVVSMPTIRPVATTIIAKRRSHDDANYWTRSDEYDRPRRW
jgi:hypothetical protein